MVHRHEDFMKVVQEGPKSRYLMMKAAWGHERGLKREKQTQEEEPAGFTE